ncbi:MAG: ribosome small subunit-dependent GTPase A [Bacteroidales bacterium]
MDTQKGIVVRSTGSWYSVKLESGEFVDCRLRGQFRIKGIKATNPIAVGDVVQITLDAAKEVGTIMEICPRENYIVRKATKLSKKSHIIASNLDQAVVIVTLALPRTSKGFIDRFLVTAEAYHIPVTIVFNKIDLYDEDMKNELEEVRLVYENIGYNTLIVSAKTKENINVFKEVLKNKRSLVAGHSGVGKSALINCIAPELDLKEGAISDYHSKGKHTTTFAQMFDLPFGGHIIDTPGIKEFGLLDFEKDEVAERFPEFRERMAGCHFSNCKHIKEPKCAVKEAVENGEIALWRYENYLNILDDDHMQEDFWKS